MMPPPQKYDFGDEDDPRKRTQPYAAQAAVGDLDESIGAAAERFGPFDQVSNGLEQRHGGRQGGGRKGEGGRQGGTRTGGWRSPLPSPFRPPPSPLLLKSSTEAANWPCDPPGTLLPSGPLIVVAPAIPPLSRLPGATKIARSATGWQSRQECRSMARRAWIASLSAWALMALAGCAENSLVLQGRLQQAKQQQDALAGRTSSLRNATRAWKRAMRIGRRNWRCRGSRRGWPRSIWPP